MTELRTQVGEIDRTINQEFVFARLCTAFAILALTIACVGLYATMAYGVARRTSEIGLRMALGAGRQAVTWMILREVCALAAVGLAIAVPAALANRRPAPRITARGSASPISLANRRRPAENRLADSGLSLMKSHVPTLPRVVLLTAAMWVGVAVTAAAQSNPIQIENAKPGTTDWLLTKVARHDDELYELGWHRRRGIEAYASHTSVTSGDTLDVHISTYPASRYSVSIYRMGYYGGAGGRLMRTVGPLQGTTEATPGDGNRKLIECSWKVGFSLEIPHDWLSGVYLGKLSTIPDPAGQYLDLEVASEAYVIFVVRDNRKADLLFQTSDMTWLAYNRWPQWRSMYDLGEAPWGASDSKVGYDVGFDRPYALYWNGYPAGFSSADQRVRRVPDDGVPAGVLARERRL